MKKIATHVVLSLLLCAFAAAPALAKVKSRVITIGQAITVGGTVVKAGTYRFSFDDQSNELTVSDRKSKEVIAKVQARAEARRSSSSIMDLQLAENGGTQTLVSVAFPGEKQAFAVAGSTSAR